MLSLYIKITKNLFGKRLIHELRALHRFRVSVFSVLAERRWELSPAAAAQWLTPLTRRCAHAFIRAGRNLQVSLDDVRGAVETLGIGEFHRVPRCKTMLIECFYHILMNIFLLCLFCFVVLIFDPLLDSLVVGDPSKT